MAPRVRRTRRSLSVSLSGLELLRVESDVAMGELEEAPSPPTIDVVAKETKESAPRALPASTKPKRSARKGRTSR